MFSISPLAQRPDFLQTCITWSDSEWRAVTGFSALDWDMEFRRVFDDPVDEIFVAHQGNSAIGMAWMVEREGLQSHNHLTPWLSNLVVAKGFRNLGIGRALIEHVSRYAALGGDPALHLLTENPSVYFSMGWDVMDIARLGSSHVYVMQRDILLLMENRRYGT